MEYREAVSKRTGDWEAQRPSDRFGHSLQPGESLIWSGGPDPALRFSPGDVFMVPFSILWAGFACSWEADAIRGGAPPLFVLSGAVFVVFGIYLVAGRFVYKIRKKRRIAYGLTMSRALIANGNSSLSEVTLSSTPTTIHRSRDGRRVTVAFGSQGLPRRVGVFGLTGMEFLPPGMEAPFCFYDVLDSDELLNALERTNPPRTPSRNAN